METVHLLITRRRAVWRVRILSGGVIRWKCYRAEDYPTPEAVARRCAAGLVTVKPENKPHEGEEGHLRGDIRPVHDSPLFAFVGSFSLGYGSRFQLVT